MPRVFVRSIQVLTVAALALGFMANAMAVPHPKRPAAKPKADASGPSYAQRADVMSQADDIAQRRNLDPQWVRQVIGSAHYLPLAAKLVTPPAKGVAKNWRAYRERFIEPKRIQAGVQFWQANRASLERAEKDYGVPAEIVVGIIGVETLYGLHNGKFRVIDTLCTLAFDFPSAHPRAAERAAYFKSELEQFLTQQQRAGSNPLEPVGSFAGAMGMPQFMPSSWVKYAVDFDGDGRIDLVNSPADVIGSVANYFKAYNWQPGVPIVFAVSLAPGQPNLDTLLAPDIVPSFSVARLQALGLPLSGPVLQYPGLLALVELQNGDPADPKNAPTYVLGTDNFYALTRYNWSSYYAMAVMELGAAVAREVNKNP